MTRHLLQTLTALALLTVGVSGPAVHASQTPAAAPALRVVSDKSYGSDTLWTEFRAIAAAKNDETFVGATERDKLDAGGASAVRLLFWRIDAAGQLASETEIKRSATSKGTNTASIRDVVTLDRREALLLVDFEAGRPSIVKVDGNGKQTTTREVGRAGRALTLFKIVPAPGGKYLLIGHEALDALMLAIDASGAVLWEKKQDRGKMDFFVDGVAAADGGFVLVGNSGEYDALRSGPSIVWIGRYDANGELKSEITFPGRYGQIAPSREHGYAVVYDKSASNDQAIQLKGLSADLKEVWETAVLSTPANFSDFKIAALAGGGFAVAGGKEGRPYVAIVDDSGRRTTTFEGTPAERSIDIGAYGLAYDEGKSLFLASSHIEARGPGDVKQKVRVRKVAM